MWNCRGYYKIEDITPSKKPGYVELKLSGRVERNSRRHGVYNAFARFSATAPEGKYRKGAITNLWVETSLAHGEVVKRAMTYDIINDFANDLKNNDSIFHVNYYIYDYLESLKYEKIDNVIKLKNKYVGYYLTPQDIVFSRDLILNSINKQYCDNLSGEYIYNFEIYDKLKNNTAYTLEDMVKIVSNTNNNIVKINGFIIVDNTFAKEDDITKYLINNINDNVKVFFLKPGTYNILNKLGYKTDNNGAIIYGKGKIYNDVYCNENIMDEENEMTPKNLEIIYNIKYKPISWTDNSYHLNKYRDIMNFEVHDRDLSETKTKLWKSSHIVTSVGSQLSEEYKKIIKDYHLNNK